MESNHTSPKLKDSVTWGSDLYSNVSAVIIEDNSTVPSFDFTQLQFNYVTNFIFYVSTIFGIPGNIFILVLAFKSMRSSSLPYITFLAIFDLGILTIYIVVRYGNMNLQQYFLAHILDISRLITNWLLALLTIERCVAVCNPLRIRIRRTSTVRNTYISITLVIVLSVVVSCLHLKTPSSIEELTESLAISTLIQIVLPGTVMAVCTYLTVLRLRKYHLERRDLVHSSTLTRMSQSESDFTRLMILSCIFFCIFHLPVIVFAELLYLIQIFPVFAEPNTLRALLAYLYIAIEVYVLNSAINFYAYLIAAQGYRKQAAHLIRSMCRKSHQ
ncbi:FMRFamide receptor [Elysia marginata]|uniref:FMRFamide receptor n=1 Tax=Elysia marginata TaxID=1093978 RepID=A0AAV4HCT7_9GAST|nr:FMRFamide receptor [Elysia marginata]